MSVTPLPATRPTRPLTVSRQYVVDARDHVVGYRISYVPTADGAPASPTLLEAAEVVDDLLTVVDPAQPVAGNTAYLPLTREMLLGGVIPPVDPTRVLLRVRYEDAIDVQLAPVIADVAERGYKLELDELPGRGINFEVLRQFHAVAIDLNRWALDDAAAVLPHLRYRNTLAMATGLDTPQQREAARGLGFAWFCGSVFGAPR